MADTKISQLPSSATPNYADILAVVTDPGSATPATKQVRIDQLISAYSSQAWIVSGRYLFPIADKSYTYNGGLTNADYGNGNVSYQPYFIPKTCTIDRISFEVRSQAGSTGSVIRSGIYRADASGWLPGTLVIDAGTVSGESIAVKEAVVSVTLTVGWYWVAVVAQGSPLTPVKLAHVQTWQWPSYNWLMSSHDNTAVNGGYWPRSSSVTGALTSNPTVDVSAGNYIASCLRIAS